MKARITQDHTQSHIRAYEGSSKKAKSKVNKRKYSNDSSSNKENVNINGKRSVLKTPMVHVKMSNLISTKASSIDRFSSQGELEESVIKEKVPIKSRRNGKVARANRPTHKAIKKNKDGTKLYKSYLILVDRRTNESKIFYLYKDKEIGFEKDLQDTIKETVNIYNQYRALMMTVRQMTSK